MAFIASLIQYLIKLVIFAVLAGAGIFAGKKLRANKDAKEAAEGTSKEQLKK